MSGNFPLSWAHTIANMVQVRLVGAVRIRVAWTVYELHHREVDYHIAAPYQGVMKAASTLLGMTFGCAVLAPRLGYLPEILGAQGSTLHRPEEQDWLRHALDQALPPREHFDTKGVHKRSAVVGYTWEQLARSTAETYGRIVAGA